MILTNPLSETQARDPFRVVQFRREDRGEDIAELLESRAILIQPKSLNPDGWQMDNSEVGALRVKLLATGQTLHSYSNGTIYYGVKTGANEVFVIPKTLRDELIHKDPRSEEIIRPFIQGTNLREWHIEHTTEYLIFPRRGKAIEEYSAVHAYLNSHRAALEPKPKGWDSIPENASREWPGRKAGSYKWYEIQDSVEYWPAFEQPKIVWPDITNYPRFSMDLEKRYLGNTGYIIPGGDYYLLGVLSSLATWFTLTGISIPFGERAGKVRYRLIAQYMEKLPIPDAAPDERDAIAKLAERCNALGTERYRLEEQVRHRLLTTFRTDEYPDGKLNEKAQEWASQEFIPLGFAVQTSFKRKQNPFTAPRTADEWEPYIKEKRAEVDKLRRQLADAEAEINERVYRLFKLSPDEIALLKREVEH